MKMFKKSTKYFKIQRIVNKKALYGTTPLHTEFPGVPRSENVNYKWTEPSVSNVDGIRVVALESNTPQTSLTLSFNSGSRVETSENTGAAAFLKQFAYSATPNYTSVGITRAIEMNTVSFNSSVSKEDISYNANLARYQLDSFFPVLGEVYNHKIREFEVRELEHNLLDQSSTLSSDPLNLLIDRFHRIAYRGEGLGNAVSPFLSRASLEHDEWVEVLREYQRTFFVRERAVVVGVGYSQQELTTLVESSFQGLAKGSNEAPKNTKYYGGENFGDRNGSTHLLIGFEGVPIISPLSHAANLVYTILGGGRKYTKEGPGNGKTSLLNRNLVEKLPNVYSASAYSANYRDSGLFGIYVNAEGQLASVVDSVYEQINSLNKVDNNQLESAKKQLKLQLSIYYDSLSRRAELAKRFVQAGLEPVSPQKFIASVDSVSLEDFRRVVKSVFSSRPVLVAEGNVAGLPSTEQLVKKIN